MDLIGIYWGCHREAEAALAVPDACWRCRRLAPPLVLIWSAPKLEGLEARFGFELEFTGEWDPRERDAVAAGLAGIGRVR